MDRTWIRCHGQRCFFEDGSVAAVPSDKVIPRKIRLHLANFARGKRYEHFRTFALMSVRAKFGRPKLPSYIRAWVVSKIATERRWENFLKKINSTAPIFTEITDFWIENARSVGEDIVFIILYIAAVDSSNSEFKAELLRFREKLGTSLSFTCVFYLDYCIRNPKIRRQILKCNMPLEIRDFILERKEEERAMALATTTPRIGDLVKVSGFEFTQLDERHEDYELRKRIQAGRKRFRAAEARRKRREEAINRKSLRDQIDMEVADQCDSLDKVKLFKMPTF